MSKQENGGKIQEQEQPYPDQMELDGQQMIEEAQQMEEELQDNDQQPNEVHAEIKRAPEIVQKKEFVPEPRQRPSGLSEMNHVWTPLTMSLSQSRMLPFIASQKEPDLLANAHEPSEIFKVLLPKKVILAICNQINAQLRLMFQGQIDEKNLKKKLFKPDQLYEYFGVKIMMGFCRMPDPEDYFSVTLPFRNRIGELIKEGRFKCVESLASFTDEILSRSSKAAKPMKQEYDEAHDTTDFVIPKIMRKINKVQRRACNPGQQLCLIRNHFFEVSHARSNEMVTCFYLQDVQTQFNLHVNFQLASAQEQSIMSMFEGYKDKNHKVYVQRNLLSMEAINHIVARQGVYCHGIVRNSTDIRFNKAELLVNGPLTLHLTKQKDPSQVFVSTADGFHKTNLNDKRPLATTLLQDNLKRAEQYSSLNEQYKCQFSCNTLSGALLTEVLELITWNSFVAYKTLIKRNTGIDYIDFRLLLAKQFLSVKLKILEQNPLPILPLHHPKTASLAIQTDKLSSFSTFQAKAPISLFHIPTMLAAPALSGILLQCIVCRRQNSQLTQCANCSEVSGKLVALCASECFIQFHDNPREFICNADDIASAPIRAPPQADSNRPRVPPRPDETQIIYGNDNVELWDDNQIRFGPRQVGGKARKPLPINENQRQQAIEIIEGPPSRPAPKQSQYL